MESSEVYAHKVDKSIIPTCNILGVDIAAINMDWLLDFTDKYIKNLSGDYMCVSNVHTTVIAYEDINYRVIQNGGIMAIPDGGPLSSIGQKRGYKNMLRTTGPSYMLEILKLSSSRKWKHYFYGGSPETLQKLKEHINSCYQGVHIAGMYSPPFRILTKEEDEEIIKKINSAQPDFIWVGLGAPKQERWMSAHQGKLTGFMVGVGAAFDYAAGNIKRAPKWMQKNNMEWFYRLIQDPKRLWNRYLKTNTKFIWNAVIKGK